MTKAIRWTPEMLVAYERRKGGQPESVPEPDRRAKYGNQKVEDAGEKFDSKKEYMRWQELKLMQQAGLINELRRQVKFEVIPAAGSHKAKFYIADFVYQQDGHQVVEDSKGVRTKDYILKRHLMAWRHNITIKET